MSKSRISDVNPVGGMPEHPTIKNFPVMWADIGDTWLFRRVTNALIPKVIDQPSIDDPIVRYAICAIKRSKANGDGIDFVMWQEIEQIQPDRETSIVTPVLCFGPSKMIDKKHLDATVDLTMKSFQEVYHHPRWITVFGENAHPVPVPEVEEQDQ